MFTFSSEWVACFPDFVVPFPGFVDFILKALTFTSEKYDYVLNTFTPPCAATTMKNTQGVPCGRGQTAPESPLCFHASCCGPSSPCTAEGTFMPML